MWFCRNIIICAPTAQPDSTDGDYFDTVLFIIIHKIREFQIWALSKGITLRGVISYGDIYFDNKNNIIVGATLNEVIEDEKKLAKYPRIIASKCLVNYISEKRNIFLYDLYHTPDRNLIEFCVDFDGIYYLDFLKFLVDYPSQEMKLLLNPWRFELEKIAYPIKLTVPIKENFDKMNVYMQNRKSIMKSNFNISDHKSQPSPFERIYQAAIERNTEAITALLSHFCIDIISAEGTPVHKLAFEGNVAVVNFLRTKFKPSLSWIVNGYALGGYFDEARKLLVLASNSAERRELLGELLNGYAQRGEVDEVEKILASASNSAERDYFVNRKADAYARRGDAAEVIKILDLADPGKRFSLLMQMLDGYTRSGHVEHANTVLLASNHKERFDLAQRMAEDYAYVGNTDEANKVLLASNDMERRLGTIQCEMRQAKKIFLDSITCRYLTINLKFYLRISYA